MAESRKVDTMPQPESFADKLRKRRMYLEEDNVEGLRETAEEISGKKKKKKDESSDE